MTPLTRQPDPRPPTGWRRLAPALTAIALMAAACGADDVEPGAADLIAEGEQATVVVANSPGTLTINGPQRVLVALVGDGVNEYIGDADTPAIIEYEPVDGDGSGGTVTAGFLSNPGVALGLYVAEITFDEAGPWQINLQNGPDALSGAIVEVGSESVVPERGQPAPPSDTPTATTAEELALITTDPEPDPALYDLSVADAVANGRPTVIVFATPAFCRTALCGPTVEIAKEAAEGRDGIDFVHVEPFEIEAARAGSLNPIPAMFDWNLVTEPWVFVVGADGTIAASFEGILGRAELDEAIEAL